jgi:uncharacterized protein YlbG (UPF0298 family)
MFPERTGLIIWIQDVKSAKALERFGAIHYVSKKMNYVVMYINKSRLEETVNQLQRLNYVKKVEHSHRGDIKTEYNSNKSDPTAFYTY